MSGPIAPENYDPSAYPPFAVTVDIVIATLRGGRMHVLLVERGADPYQGAWALPGGFVEPDEDADTAAKRELIEETGIGRSTPVHLEQLRTYSDPGRDPRMRVVSVAYVALAPDLPDPVAGSDAAVARWWAVDDVVDGEIGLAFDHARILSDAVERIRAKLEYATVATSFLPRVFTLGELRAVYTEVWGEALDLQNFRRKVLAVPGFVEPVDEVRTGVPGPRAQLYRAGDATEIVPPFRRAPHGEGR
ncbi:NUDIX hydrolase [Myceligenerans crystallogenes]|uniref:NUDIX hydrolase n=1 Tax=Myceligenerans crystallogenes TaxID=316335 RepID=UPI0031CE2F3B